MKSVVRSARKKVREHIRYSGSPRALVVLNPSCPLFEFSPPLFVEYALLLTVLIRADVLFVLWTQHFANADDADAEDALITLEAAYKGFLPLVRIVFLEKSMSSRVAYGLGMN